VIYDPFAQIATIHRELFFLQLNLAPLRLVALVALLLATFAATGFAAESPESTEARQSSTAPETSSPARADGEAEADRESPAPRGRIKRWGLTFSGFLVSFDTRLRWETSLPVTPEIDLEQDLGLDEELTRARFGAALRVGKRSLLSLEYIRLRRASVQTVLSDPIVWDDELFRAGARVESDFDTDIYKLGWTWSAVRKPRFDLALSLGISAIDFAASIRGIATAGGGPGTPEFRNEEEEALVAPVPVIGIRLGGNLRHDLIVRGHAQYFRYTDDKLGAELIDVLVAVEYIPFTHVGFGLGYDYFDIRYRQDKYDLEVRYLFEGPIIYLRLLY